MKFLGTNSTVSRRSTTADITFLIPVVCLFTVLVMVCLMKTILVWFSNTWPSQGIPKIKITEPSSCFGTYYEDIVVKDTSYDYLSPNKIYL